MYNNKKTSPTKFKMQNKGFSLVENLVAVALLGIVIVAGTQGFDYIRKGTQQMTTLDTNENRVFEIIQRIRATVSKNIVSYPASVVSGSQTGGETSADQKILKYIDEKLNVSSLPMAWSLQSDEPAASCPSCPGRYGYTIVSVPGFGSLYKVTVRMTHKDWGIKPTDFKEYNFVISQ